MVRPPLRTWQAHDIYRDLPADEFDAAQPTWQGRLPTSWNLLLTLDGAHPPAASATINLHPEDCPRGAGWSIDELHVWARYRGAGLDENIIRQAQTILARGGLKLETPPHAR